MRLWDMGGKPKIDVRQIDRSEEDLQREIRLMEEQGGPLSEEEAALAWEQEVEALEELAERRRKFETDADGEWKDFAYGFSEIEKDDGNQTRH